MSSTFGILAHVDAGKTTLSEQILLRAGVIRKAGRVDNKDTFLDTLQVERDRGITVLSDQADFQLGTRNFFLIDTPGHTDFAGEMERCLGVLDFAVLVISAVEGIQSHTETIIKMLKARRIPFFVFINKCDRAGADAGGIMTALSTRFGLNVLGVEAFPSPSTAEAIAETDEALLEAYFSGNLSDDMQIKTVKEHVKSFDFTPVLAGSALSGNGIDQLLKIIELVAPEYIPEENTPFSVRVYKVRHHPAYGRRVFFKVLGGRIAPRETIDCPGGCETVKSEKINELLRVSGTKSTPLQIAEAGELCAATGLLLPLPGDILGANAERRDHHEFQPLLRARVIYPSGVDVSRIFTAFKELEDEEPLLGVSWDPEARELFINIIGDMQLEITAELMRERYGFDISFGECTVLYRETISAPVMGYGHFEPLRHYAEVHMLLSPGKPGSGITFESICPLSALEKRWQNLVETHVFEKNHLGALTGSPLADIKVTLVRGRAHLEHTEGGDFREATYRAIRQGLMYAQSALLEPWYAFEITVEHSMVGRVLSDIQRLSGSYEPPIPGDETSVIVGRAPVFSFRRYPAELAAITKGTGIISLRFDCYKKAHNTSEIIASFGYEPDRDRDNTADSMFCSHGAGYLVKWHDAQAAMHLETDLPK